jgi:hypothetical protein
MPPPPKGQNLGAIIGGSVGGGVGLLLILAAVWYFWRRRKSRRLAKEKESTLAETETKRLSPDDGPSFFDSTETPDSTYATDLQRTIAGIPPAAHLTTAELVAHKMNEARDASSTTTRQRSDPSTLLSPTSGGTFGPGTFGTDTFGGGTFLSGGGTLIEPQTLPPLKLSLMTGSLAREASSLSPYQQAPLPSPMRTSPLRTSPRLAEPEELLPEHEATVTEEQDAGRVPASETVPPRYNPAWADDYTSNNPNAAQRTHPSEQLPATAVTHSPISPTDSTLRLFNVSEQQVHAADDAGDASDVTPSPNSEVGPSVVQHW